MTTLICIATATAIVFLAFASQYVRLRQDWRKRNGYMETLTETDPYEEFPRYFQDSIWCGMYQSGGVKLIDMVVNSALGFVKKMDGKADAGKAIEITNKFMREHGHEY